MTSVLLNSMGHLTFSDAVDQIDLDRDIEIARECIRNTQNGVLLLEGGDDVHPREYGSVVTFAEVSNASKRRDERERELIRAALHYRRPIIGLCRGHQLLAVHMGGTLVQDIIAELGAHHRQYHHIRTEGVFTNYAPLELEVNSYHHQSVRRIPDGAMQIATAYDGVNEGLYYPEHRAISFQWHPEFVDDFDLLNWALIQIGAAPTRVVNAYRVYR